MLKLTLSEYEFSAFEYGQVDFNLYNKDESAYNATGLTAVVSFFKRPGDQAIFFRDVAKGLELFRGLARIIQDLDVTWDTIASGDGHFTFTTTDRPTIFGHMWIQVTLSNGKKSELKRVYVHPSNE